MYDPAARPSPSLAFLWPAFAAAAAGDMASLVARKFAKFAIDGTDGQSAPEPSWTTPHKVALELKTVRLRDFTIGPREQPPTLLCAPFALHSAAVTDLAVGHSLVAALQQFGLRHLLVTDWRSATSDMRFLGIDDYLADLNVLVDAIGAPVDLIGLCQGGWMSLIYAARFPDKVRKLVLAGAPVDIAAAPSALSALAETSPLAIYRELVRLGDGLLPGRNVLKFWGSDSVGAQDIRQLMQTDEAIGSPGFAHLKGAFETWNSFTVDLPGTFFLECVEKLYKRNELATGCFVALGRTIDLASVTIPLFLLAARDDELVAPQQVFAVEHLVGTPARNLRQAIAPCRHVGLFIGKMTLEHIWSQIAHWLHGTTDDRQAVQRGRG
jgi:poly(3-hydroxybutyrate) depolymerase